MTEPLVSVIIPTRNSAETIGKCLDSIQKQTYQETEIIVVDNHSDDETSQISRDYGVRFLKKGPERSAQRNYGAKQSKGDFLMFIDSDMELTPRTVTYCVEKSINRDCDAIIIPEMTVGKGFWVKVRRLERATYIGDTLFEAARFFRRNTFSDLGGFDEEMTGSEDYDLQAKLEKNNYRIMHVDPPIIHNEGNLRFGKHLMKKYYYAQGSKKYLNTHPEKAIRQLLPLRRSFFRQWRLLLKNPVHALGLITMKTCEFLIGGLAFIRTSD